MFVQQRQTHNKKSTSQNQGRRKPGSAGRGAYYHIEVRREGDFVAFRTQDVGRRGHIQRVAGQRSTGYWATVKWLIGKEDAHLDGNQLVPDTKDAKDVIEQLSSQPVRLIGDRFRASPRRDIREEAKPTPAQRRERGENIKKVQAARKKRKK